MVKTTQKIQPLDMLLIAPAHDLPTLLSANMAQELYNVLKDVPNLRINHLNWIEATPMQIEKVLEMKHYPLIVYFGHGKEESWYHGIWKELASFEDAALFKDSIVCTMACRSAESFGQQLIDYGARAYLGNTEVIWGASDNPSHRYSVDFKRIWQNEVINLLRGWTAGAVVAHTKARIYDLAFKYRTDDNLWDGDEIATKFEFNAEYRTCLGDKHAKLPRVIRSKRQLNGNFLF